MKFNPITTLNNLAGLLTFRSFTPDINDSEFPIAKRMKGNTIAVISSGPLFVRVAQASKRGKSLELDPGTIREYPAIDGSAALPDEALETAKAYTDCGCCVLAISSAETEMSIQTFDLKEMGISDANIHERIHSAPETFIKHHEKDRIYQAILEPKKDQHLFVSIPRKDRDEANNSLKESGLKVLKSQIAEAAMLDLLLGDDLWTAFLSKNSPNYAYLPIILHQGTFNYCLYHKALFGGSTRNCLGRERIVLTKGVVSGEELATVQDEIEVAVQDAMGLAENTAFPEPTGADAKALIISTESRENSPLSDYLRDMPDQETEFYAANHPPLDLLCIIL